MRYFFPDPDNSERLIKTPLHIVEQIRADALREAAEAVRTAAFHRDGGLNTVGIGMSSFCCGCSENSDAVLSLIAVIEALGEQQ